MSNSHNAVRWVARTAMGIALIILAQLLGKVFPAGAVIVGPFSVNQLVTCLLYTSAADVVNYAVYASHGNAS